MTAEIVPAIISIYREGVILKRLRATPLTPTTILAAHVFLKLALTADQRGRGRQRPSGTTQERGRNYPER